MTETATEERLLRDYRNAEVYAPEVHEAPFRRARAFVTSHRVIVWAEDSERQIHKVLDEPITGEERPAADRGTQHGPTVLETARGTVYVSKGAGCGCGSVLKALSAPVEW